MQEEIEKIVNRIDEELEKEEFQKKHKTRVKDFIRTRKLGFKDVVKFVLGLSNTSFDFETENFCNAKKIKISMAALCKARDKVKYEAFRELLRISQREIASPQREKGYRVIAVDGTEGELPNTPELMKKYKANEKSQYPQFSAVASFDVLNCKFIDAEFAAAPSNERELAYALIKKHEVDKDIFLYDRGFASVELIQKLNTAGIKFVARAPRNFLKEVQDFAKTKSTDKDLQINYTTQRAKKSKSKDVVLPYKFSLRCVKIELPSGETELLMTNLSKDQFKSKEIGKLYSLRWGIETSFNHLKNAINIENFVGIKENSIKQEFYSVLIKYNIVMLCVKKSDAVVFSAKKKHQYKTNIRKACAIIIPKFMRMLFVSLSQLSSFIDSLTSSLIKYASAVRKDRSFPRHPNKSAHSVNYKRNFLLS